MEAKCKKQIKNIGTGLHAFNICTSDRLAETYFHLQSLKGTLLCLRLTHFFGSVIFMQNHALKASNVLLI